MKKLTLTLALAGILGAGLATPALACKDDKCKMDHSTSSDKSKKGKKAAAKAETCNMATATAGEAKSCCMKKETAKAPVTEVKKENR